MPDEITFQNDPVDPSVEFRKQHRGRWHRFAEDEGTALDGPAWHTLEVEEVPAVVLVRDGASPAIAEPAQHTGALDWDGARGWRPAA
jgi:hypothetical protein